MIDLQAPLPWLVGSPALALIATNLAWTARGRLVGRSGTASLPALGWLAVSLFYLLPPAMAWQNGALSPYWLGLTEIDWVASLAAGAPLAMLLAGVLLLGWLIYRRTLPRAERLSNPAGQAGLTLKALVDAALRQWHWAFYRALAIGTLATAAGVQSLDAAYWGTWLAAVLTAGEWLLNPYARLALSQSGPREDALRQAALAAVTSALFLVSRNFYVSLALHLAVDLLITGWFPLPSRVEPAAHRA